VTRIQFLETAQHFASSAISFADIGKSVEYILYDYVLYVRSVVANRKRTSKLQLVLTIRWFQYLLTCFNISVDTEVQAVF
jgi:hypothetical protein